MIAVELARETDGAGDARQPRAHQVVQITLEPLSPLREKGELAPRLTWTDDFFIDFGSRLLIKYSY